MQISPNFSYQTDLASCLIFFRRMQFDRQMKSAPKTHHNLNTYVEIDEWKIDNMNAGNI